MQRLTDDADASVTGLTAYYRDSDNDTHGDASVTLNACAIPDGYSATADDCDDTRGRRFTPTAVQIFSTPSPTPRLPTSAPAIRITTPTVTSIE